MIGVLRRRGRQRRQRGWVVGLGFALATGFLLLLAGGWAMLRGVGAPLPGIEEMWPIFPVIGSFPFFLGYLANRRAFGLVLPGALALLTGLFFFPFSFGVLDWSRMEQLWPVFPLIGGVAFLLMWAAAFFRFWGLLIPAFLGVATGLIGASLTMTPLGGAVGAIGWPVALLATGASLILMVLLGLTARVLRLVSRG